MSASLGRPREAAVIRPHPSRVARFGVVLALLAGAASGLVLGLQAAPATEPELMNLLRAMAVLKLAFVTAAAGAIFWRLQAPVRPAWLAAYAATCAAMAAGPALIWFASHVIAASILLHGGLAVAALLLWRDGVVADLLRATVLRRRSTPGD